MDCIRDKTNVIDLIISIKGQRLVIGTYDLHASFSTRVDCLISFINDAFILKSQIACVF